jgi:transcriptional regulator with XRE-family HTH domain
MVAENLYPNNLKYWIKKRGYKLSEVADYLKISPRTLTDYCAGRLAISHDKLEAITALLGCSLSALRADRAPRPGYTSFFVEDDEMILRRRDVLRLLMIASGALALPLPSLDFDRMTAAIARPQLLDETAALHLEGVNSHYWGIYRAAVNKASVLDGAQGHLKTLVAALQDSRVGQVRKRLASCVSDLAQLIGEIYFDMRDYGAAQSCYAFAISAAQAGGHMDLLACAYARNCYLPIYDEAFDRALPLVQAARLAVAGGDSQLAVKEWVESIAAETFAGLRRSRECRVALDLASGVDGKDVGESPAWLRFEGTRLPALRGSCLVRLGDAQASLAPLGEALLAVPGPVRRRAMILTDLGLATVLQGEIERACAYGREATAIAADSSSVMLREGLHRLGSKLEPFSDNAAVREFGLELAALS